MYLLSVLLWSSIAIIALVALWLRWRPDRASRCGQCGARVNATSTTCPKCGHDLREAGISTPAIRRHGIGPMRPWLIWFLVVTVPLIALIVRFQQTARDGIIWALLDHPYWTLLMPLQMLGPITWLLLPIPAVLVLWKGLRHQSVQPDPQCGHCGYGVRGISTMMCPECGSNLQQVGIITPPLQNLRRTSRLGWAVGWLLAILPISLLGSAYTLFRFGPNETRFAFRQGITCHTSALNVVMRAEVSARIQYWGYVSPPIIPASQRQLTLRLEYPRKSPICLHADARTWRSWLTGQSGSTPGDLGQFNGNAIQTWLAATGCDISKPGIDETTDTIPLLISRNMSGPPLGLSAFAGSGKPLGAAPLTNAEYIYLQDVRFDNSAGLQWWGILVAAAFWLLIWLLGIWLVLRRSRSSIEADTVPSLSPDAPS